jgi:gas vesicle protein
MRRFSKTQVAGLFLTGATVGAAVALLFAPKAGAQTRKDLRRFSKRTVNQLDDLQSGFVSNSLRAMIRSEKSSIT